MFHFDFHKFSILFQGVIHFLLFMMCLVLFLAHFPLFCTSVVYAPCEDLATHITYKHYQFDTPSNKLGRC
jgi:formate-dependent nitrite reductase membrane component NrfD